MFLLRSFLSIGLLLCSFTLLGQKHPKVSEAPEPKWTVASQLPLEADTNKDPTAGFYYLLVDNQDNLATDQQYRRLSYRIKNSMGSQQMSDLTVNFDPAYQHVEIHSINIIREGKTINKLDLDKIKVVQRESEMDDKIYNGQLTIISHLTDIRINDIIDFSYTITGSNPLFKGKYATAFALQFNVPVEFHRYIIVVPKKDKIHIKRLHGAEKPEIEEQENEIHYSWTGQKLEQITIETNTPVWFDDTPSVFVSQFNSWQEVSELLLPFYTLNNQEKKQLKSEVDQLITDTKDQKDFIEKSIRFVQDEIRYLGLESGLNSYVPRQPQEVLDMRFGDCKDKSFLLSEILQTRGLNAKPVLVHSFNGRNLKSYIASPYLFDHCVVQIKTENQDTYYVDPTISEQGGNLETLYFPDYRLGLLLSPGENDLLDLPKPKIFPISINETFELLEIGGGAKLDVVSIYKGNAAELRRQQFLNTNFQAIQQEYSNYYTSLYPSIYTKEALRFEDDRKTNTFKVIESYQIDDFWTPSTDNANLILARFYPLALEPNLFPQQSGKRKSPYYLEKDSKIQHNTIVYFPRAWNIKNEKRSYGNQYFQYNSDISYKNATLKITHDYSTLKDHVAPEDITSFLMEHSKIQKQLNYWLQYNHEAVIASEQNSISWIAVMFLLFILIGSGVICYLIYSRYDLPSKVKPKYERKIGGWLILIGIGLAVTPLFLFFRIFTSNYFESSVWISLFSNTNTISMGLILIAEMIFNSIYFVFSIFVVILFFQRRTIAPRMIIALYAGVLILSGIITFTTLYLHPSSFTGSQTQELYTDLSAMVIRCLIFIPYFLYSERVEETFTKRKKGSGEQEEKTNEQILEQEEILIN